VEAQRGGGGRKGRTHRGRRLLSFDPMVKRCKRKEGMGGLTNQRLARGACTAANENRKGQLEEPKRPVREKSWNGKARRHAVWNDQIGSPKEKTGTTAVKDSGAEEKGEPENPQRKGGRWQKATTPGRVAGSHPTPLQLSGTKGREEIESIAHRRGVLSPYGASTLKEKEKTIDVGENLEALKGDSDGWPGTGFGGKVRKAGTPGRAGNVPKPPGKTGDQKTSERLAAACSGPEKVDNRG